MVAASGSSTPLRSESVCRWSAREISEPFTVMAFGVLLWRLAAMAVETSCIFALAFSLAASVSSVSASVFGVMPAVMVSVISESLSGPISVSTVPAAAQRMAIMNTARYLRQ